jgi:23S rRNA (uracil1939-C5)-methyltransferase
VLQPAPERIVPLCRHFGVCGGCQWQHIDYAAQLRFKAAIVASQLQRIGGVSLPPVEPMLGMEEPWGYRNHVQLKLTERGELGYQALHSHTVVPIEECWVIEPLIGELWNALDLDPEGPRAVALRAGVGTGEQMLILQGDDEAPPELELDLPVSCVYQPAHGEPVVLAGSAYLHERLARRDYRISAGSFFQVNTWQAERMLALVLDYLAARPGERILDAYCGVGTFALALAAQGVQGVGIEDAPSAIADARANVAAGESVEFIQGAVEQVLPGLGGTFAGAVLDPPRVGCAPAALEALARAQPGRIVYVSCDPATLARDVARLAALGYTLAAVQPIDMFPQTYHIEAVALLRLTTEPL